MSNITIKRVGELVRGLFEILWNKPDGLTAKEVFTLFPKTIQLTQDEISYYASTHLPRFERIVRLATIPLVHAGWLSKTDEGRWSITEEGYQACSRFVNAQDFYKEAMRLHEERRQSPPESILVMELAQEAAWAQIEKHFQQLHHRKLQSMLAELLRAMDYYPSWIAPPEKDRGRIDVIAFVDPIGAKGHRILAQVKHTGQSITLEGVRSFSSALGPNDYGVVFSTSGFTKEAMRMVASGTFEKITALDTIAFFDLWKQHYSQLSQESRRLLPLKSIYFLSRDS